MVALRMPRVNVSYLMWCPSTMTCCWVRRVWCLGSSGLAQLPIPPSPGFLALASTGPHLQQRGEEAQEKAPHKRLVTAAPSCDEQMSSIT